LNPSRQINILDTRQQHLSRRLINGLARSIEGKKQALATLSHTLDTVSPLATLSRGYAITSRQENGAIVRSFDETRIGEIVETRLSRGRLICWVTETKEN
ncbi:MAG: exodeoxyribonuclease VII large subunit, partial [Methylococcales bacterium]